MTVIRPRWVLHLIPVTWALLMGGLLLVYRTDSTVGEWSIPQLVGVATVEALVLFALLRPLSFRYHSGRGLAALFALIVISTYWAANAPLIFAAAYTLHLLWLMALVVAVCVLLGFSLWQQLMQRHR